MKQISIKNMVCPRCITAVKDVLEKLNIQYLKIELGTVLFKNTINELEHNDLKMALKEMGFEFLNDKKAQLIEQIKNEIIKVVHHRESSEQIGNITNHLSNAIGRSYSSLSKLFSEIEGTTIEKYLILQKIEKAKELLFYEELSISEIAYQLNYSSSQHFSKQFKSITGLTPSEFSDNKKTGRNPINEI
ncbi:AraC family transcriptional regulator [Labilibaculum sp. DW002]|uniref:AraC family transcriptional regulator n=1 Tax=Paralabilibaculum antarcticum TaxID=2912572 RepID=A0ABT5VQB9_9BACT|nr:AraC family transcriptional regulator [Labilibaculum sp. DW002]MDE5417624.1 AraC family transcriptional regulator [Labilibaculum sp. DW002]